MIGTMAGPPKSDPLETFLTGVSSQVSRPSEPSADVDPIAAGSSVLLTILSKEPAGVKEDDLRGRSELGAELFEPSLRRLVVDGLAELDQTAGYRLTERGQEAARQVRERLLKLW
jgi:hypothetical protein